jgi:hypothetical protein
MLSHIVHSGTIYHQTGSINVLARLSDVYDVYDIHICALSIGHNGCSFK